MGIEEGSAELKKMYPNPLTIELYTAARTGDGAVHILFPPRRVGHYRSYCGLNVSVGQRMTVLQKLEKITCPECRQHLQEIKER